MAELLRDRCDWEHYRQRDGRYDDPTCLYRYFADWGELLYIGVARWPWKRDLQHFKQSRWRQAASFMQIEVFPRRGVAGMAEALAIASEQPSHNVKQPTPDDTVYPADEWFLLPRGGKFVGDDPMWARLPFRVVNECWMWDEPVACDAPTFAAPLARYNL